MEVRGEAVPAFEQRAELGECPVWDAAGQALWWIDWALGIVYRSDVATGVSISFPAGPSLAALAPTPSGRLALALGHGFGALDPSSGRVRDLARAEPDEVATRMCDGKCDAQGRFWAGTMALDERSPIGALFVLETDGRVRRVLDGVVVSNGLGWSPQGTRLYYIDTATGRVDGFDFDPARGTITNRAPLIEIPSSEGAPDGLTVDREGCLWIALWDGWQVRRYSPGGELDTVIELPVARPTCCALGGRDLRDLFITTAPPDSESAREAQPLAGRVLRAHATVPGLPAHACAYAPG
ncbi:MAG: SMP-30/gluconolactonase/LRE family protein [Thermoleophilia bacterium]